MRVFFVGFFYGFITPGGIGWHIRIFYMRKKTNASLEKCLVNSLIDSTSAFIMGLFLALIGSIMLFDRFPGIFPVVFVFFVFFVTAFVVLFKKSRGDRLFKIFVRPFIPGKYKPGLDQSVESLYEDIPRLRDMFVPFLMEFFIWIALGTQAYIIAQAFSVDIPYITFILISIISVVATGILPIAVGGLGVREGTFVLLASSFGIEPQIAFVISLSGFVVKLFVPLIIGLVLSFKKDV